MPLRRDRDGAGDALGLHRLREVGDQVAGVLEADREANHAIGDAHHGAGLRADQRAEVIKRGARLDESAPGSGLGLSIVDELARAYGGAITLADSPMGGLRVVLELPRSEG